MDWAFISMFRQSRNLYTRTLVQSWASSFLHIWEYGLDSRWCVLSARLGIANLSFARQLRVKLRSNTYCTLQGFFFNESNLQGRRNASTIPLFTNYLSCGAKSNATQQILATFRNKVLQLNPRFLAYITQTWRDYGFRLHDSMAINRDFAQAPATW